MTELHDSRGWQPYCGRAVSGGRITAGGFAVATLYVATPSGSYWHILRPNHRDRVWCQDNVDTSSNWTQITLHTPSAICSVCFDAETVSLTNDQNRVPALAGAF
jgi:hypothetical protein